MIGKRARWVVGGLGFLLPCSWLAATVLLYAWLPGFRGSSIVFWLIMFLAVVITGASGLTAPTGGGFASSDWLFWGRSC